MSRKKYLNLSGNVKLRYVNQVKTTSNQEGENNFNKIEILTILSQPKPVYIDILFLVLETIFKFKALLFIRGMWSTIIILIFLIITCYQAPGFLTDIFLLTAVYNSCINPVICSAHYYHYFKSLGKPLRYRNSSYRS